jgi:PRTRC genetic system protein C
MLIANSMERVFLFKYKQKEITLSDPETSMTAENVLNFYSQTYPVLTTAKLKGPEIINDQVVYKFVPTIGTKG